tara:strand:+ start:828 stop:1085 length:258 start_codon:yes stop_codon:yes gene_type:complete
MSEKLEILKKKILYRSSYRGSKEMDILLGSFVKKYINELNFEQLLDLEKFLELDDEVILDYYNNNSNNKKVGKKFIHKIFLNFKK